MSHLLYSIFRWPVPPGLEIPPGVGRQPISLVNHQDLGAVISELAPREGPPAVPEIVAYGEVVEAFYRQVTVIPMRYGCRVEDPREAVRLLAENHDGFSVLLHELDGLAEMGIQALLDSPDASADTEPTTLLPRSSLLHSDLSGTAYLAAKRLHHLGTDRTAQRQSELVEKLSSALSGLFVRRKAEWSAFSKSRLLSVYFLVPRGSVETFRQTSRQLFQREPTRLLLSGPWPPYNFLGSIGRRHLS
jgi:hypothetical protein